MVANLRPAEPHTGNLDVRARFRLALSAAKLAWWSSKRETVLVVALQALFGLSFPLQLFAGKWALEEVVNAAHPGSMGAPGNSPPGPHPHENIEIALLAVAVAVAAVVVSRVIGAVSRQRQRIFPQLVRKTVLRIIGEKANTLDLQTLEAPKFADTFTRVQREASYRPSNMVYDMMTLVASGVSIVVLGIMLLSIEPLLALVLPLASLPQLLASVNSARAFYQHMSRNTHKERLMWHLGELMTRPTPVKETQALGLGSYLLERQQTLFGEQISDLRSVVGRSARREVLAALVSGVVMGGAIFLAVSLYFSGQLSVADSVASAGALMMVSMRMNIFVMSAGMLYENVLFIEDLQAVLDLEPRWSPMDAPKSPKDAPKVPALTGLSVENVTFSYPETARRALQSVSIEVKAGETVALVGENGAGKTTLAKLICRLYEPDSGQIKWNGADIRVSGPDEYRRQVAAVFQDFTRYELSARENVGFGDVDAVDDVTRVVQAARCASAHDFLDGLPNGYATVLGRLFDQGHELSVGEWQRVALARAFFRDASLVVMDEPTASLDARAEANLFQLMNELFANKAVLLISHRFSSVRMADRIYVLRDGQIVEEGSHEQLMASRGLYAELFSIQASAYAAEKALGAT